MAKTTETIEKNGFAYSIHNVSINGGKKKIGTIECPKPTAETLQKYIDANIVTYADLCLFYGKGKAVALQAEARRVASTGKMNKSEYNRLFAIHCDGEMLAEARIDADEKKQNFGEYIEEYLTVIWDEERTDDESTESEA